jgi:aquaporin Z
LSLGPLDVRPSWKFQPDLSWKLSRRAGIEQANMRLLPQHWREYVTEAVCLGLFMVSAAGFATLLRHPASPLSEWNASPMAQRIPMGIAMGLTAMAIIYSPLGMRSGAHMNPAVTLTFLRLGKITARDAVGYVTGQFAGGVLGILTAAWLFRGLPAHPSVNYVATVPGAMGSLLAFAAEATISFGMMSMVLGVSNTPHLARFTGLGAGILVATFIIFEAPLSGMSMNPARTFGPSLLAHTARTLWIYFTAPPLGMLLAAERFSRRHGLSHVRCAKLHHPTTGHCIFNCAFVHPDDHSMGAPA